MVDVLGWITETIGNIPSVPYDLTKVKNLAVKNFKYAVNPYYENIPEWLIPKEGDFSLIGELPNLKSLEFPKIEIDDFSFLIKCKNLQKLDLRNTNFKDCLLLEELPNLTYVYLGNEKTLNNPETLSNLKAKVEIDKPFYRNEQFKELKIQSKTEIYESKDGQGYSVCYIEVNHKKITDITEKWLKEFLADISNGKVESICLSPDENGEIVFMTVDIKDGWAAVALCDEENESFYTSYNPKYTDFEELAPPQIGGQSPVPKPLAFDDLKLVADCIVYYIQTGELYPGAEWMQQ